MDDIINLLPLMILNIGLGLSIIFGLFGAFLQYVWNKGVEFVIVYEDSEGGSVTGTYKVKKNDSITRPRFVRSLDGVLQQIGKQKHIGLSNKDYLMLYVSVDKIQTIKFKKLILIQVGNGAFYVEKL